MRKWSRYLAGVVAVTGLLALVTAARAETCKLEMKKVDPSARVRSGGQVPEYMFRNTYPQHFFTQIGAPQGRIVQPGQKDKPEFSKLITKEPDKYNTPYPFRGVAKLGSEYYGFVFDTAPEEEKEEDKKKEDKKKEEKVTGTFSNLMDLATQLVGKKKESAKLVRYTRLHFDLNHDGDLTDDKVIKAASSQAYSPNYVHASFPRVDLAIEVDGAKVDYAFTISVYTRASRDYVHANASLNAAAYHEGEITLDGKKRRVVVVDFNSNGQFNDESAIRKNVRTADGTVYPTQGDRVYVIDPEKGITSANWYDISSNDAAHYVSKLVNLDGIYHDLTISPAGDTLTLTPSTIPVGHVTNPNQGYRAIVYGEKGFLKVVGDESGKAPLPEGEWKLLSYTIDRTGLKEPEKAEEKSKDEAKKEVKKEAKADGRSLVEVLKDSFLPGFAKPKPRSRPTLVAARAKSDYKPVKVTKGRTVELPFGPPYRPVVTAPYARGKGKVSLAMSLVGVAGESCSNLTVNGGRPGKPKFVISTEDDKEVVSGSFEYG